MTCSASGVVLMGTCVTYALPKPNHMEDYVHFGYTDD